MLAFIGNHVQVTGSKVNHVSVVESIHRRSGHRSHRICLPCIELAICEKMINGKLWYGTPVLTTGKAAHVVRFTVLLYVLFRCPVSSRTNMIS